MILPCKCVHKAQDELHGKQLRVHNEFKDKAGNPMARCTVCHNEKPAK